MSLPHILLGLLRQPASGYDLKATFDQGFRHFWSAELSQIYPTLKRLEEKGWLKARSRPSEKGPDRRIYRLTGAGRAELRNWLQSGPIVGSERFAYLAQLALMDELQDFAATHAFMLALRARLAAWHAELVAIEAGMAHELPGFPDDLPIGALHDHFTLRMGLHTLAAKLAWCDETIARLEGRMNEHSASEREPEPKEA